jgi:hypothetical protein
MRLYQFTLQRRGEITASFAWTALPGFAECLRSLSAGVRRLTTSTGRGTSWATMSRGLGRIERTILTLVEDKRVRRNGFAAETLAVAAYQSRTELKRLPTKAERVAVARAIRSLADKYPDRIVLKGGEGRPPWLERRR